MQGTRSKLIWVLRHLELNRSLGGDAEGRQLSKFALARLPPYSLPARNAILMQGRHEMDEAILDSR